MIDRFTRLRRVTMEVSELARALTLPVPSFFTRATLREWAREIARLSGAPAGRISAEISVTAEESDDVVLPNTSWLIMVNGINVAGAHRPEEALRRFAAWLESGGFEVPTRVRAAMVADHLASD